MRMGVQGQEVGQREMQGRWRNGYRRAMRRMLHAACCTLHAAQHTLRACIRGTTDDARGQGQHRWALRGRATSSQPSSRRTRPGGAPAGHAVAAASHAAAAVASARRAGHGLARGGLHRARRSVATVAAVMPASTAPGSKRHLTSIRIKASSEQHPSGGAAQHGSARQCP